MLLGTAALFATGGTAIKLTQLSGIQVAGLRSGIAALFLFAAVPAARRWPSRPIAAVSVAYAACLVLFVLANKLTTAAHAIFLQSTSVVWVVLASPAVLGEPVTRRDVLALSTVSTGMLLMMGAEQAASAVATAPAWGNAIAAASGVCWAATGLGLRWLSTRAPDPAAAAGAPAWGNALALLTTAPFMGMAKPGLLDLAALAWLGLFQIGLAYLWMTRAIRHIGAVEASLLLLAEPVMSTALAAVVHEERPSPLAAAGAGVMLAGLALHAWMAPAPLARQDADPT
jgi:drug/metabolite transporter (DMT)-like permease